MKPTPAVIDSGRDVAEADFLQPGTAQVAAGYAIYGPATMLMLTVGNGVVGFTLDPNLGEFKLTHPDVRVPADTLFSVGAAALAWFMLRLWVAPRREKPVSSTAAAAAAAIVPKH